MKARDVCEARARRLSALESIRTCDRGHKCANGILGEVLNSGVSRMEECGVLAGEKHEVLRCYGATSAEVEVRWRAVLGAARDTELTQGLSRAR